MGVGLTEEEVDVAALLAAGMTMQTLHAVIPRGKNEQWAVAHSPLDLHARVEWGAVRDGEYVYVPVIPYRTHADAARALKYAITLGLRAGLDTQVLPCRDIKRLYLVTGKVAEDLSASEGVEALRFYLGFAVQTH